jgi:predicted PurR-regulated permease PerM
MSITADPFYRKLSFNLLSIALIIVLLYVAQEILVPIFIALLLATLLLPVVQFFLRWRINNLWAILITMVLAIIITATVIYFLSAQIISFFDEWPAIKDRFSDLAVSLKLWVKEHLDITIQKQNQYIKETTNNMQHSAGGFVGKTFLSLTEILSYIVLLPIYTFLILYYRYLIVRFLIDVFKNSHEEKVRDILHESQAVSQRYIRGLIIEMTIVFALNAVGFLIIGIQYAFFLGLVAAILNLIPYIGMLVANVFCMLITLISSDNIADVLWVGVILAIVQVIDNNFLMPMIVGSNVRINVLASIVGVLVGGALCGVAGMFLSIPGLAILKVIFDRVNGLKPYGMLLGDYNIARKTHGKHNDTD